MGYCFVFSCSDPRTNSIFRALSGQFVFHFLFPHVQLCVGEWQSYYNVLNSICMVKTNRNNNYFKNSKWRRKKKNHGVLTKTLQPPFKPRNVLYPVTPWVILITTAIFPPSYVTLTSKTRTWPIWSKCYISTQRPSRCCRSVSRARDRLDRANLLRDAVRALRRQTRASEPTATLYVCVAKRRPTSIAMFVFWKE